VPSLVELGAGSLLQWHVVMAMPWLQVKRSQQASLLRPAKWLLQVMRRRPVSEQLRRRWSLQRKRPLWWCRKLRHPLPRLRHNSYRRS
jgi:hypothetical protein